MLRKFRDQKYIFLVIICISIYLVIKSIFTQKIHTFPRVDISDTHCTHTYFAHTNYCHLSDTSLATPKIKGKHFFSNHSIFIVRVCREIKWWPWKYYSLYFFFIIHINLTMVSVEHLKWVWYPVKNVRLYQIIRL